MLMPLKHTLLGLLQWQPMHGYLLRQHAKEYAWIYPMANASIYPALHALEKDGFIDHKPEIHNGRARKVYEITDAGRQELRHWLVSGADQKPSFRDQMLLKIAMQSDETMPDARSWLEETLAEVEAEAEAVHVRHRAARYEKEPASMRAAGSRGVWFDFASGHETMPLVRLGKCP